MPPVLRRMLAIVFAIFALLAVNSAYLAGVTLTEHVSGRILQDDFYLWMFLAHLGLGLVLLVPFILFGITHLRRAWRNPNRAAVRAGLSLFVTALILLASGLVLTRFGFFEVNHPLIRMIGYWVHVITPLVMVWLFVLHRLAGPAIHWRRGLRWAMVAVIFATVVPGLHYMKTGEKHVAERYFEPALVKTTFQPGIDPGHLMDDTSCAECHVEISRTWEMSMHRVSSFNNPAYKFSVDETREFLQTRDGNVHAARLCAVCHDPVPLFSGRFDQTDFDGGNDATAHAGLTCISCHAITAVNSPRGNGDYTLIDPPR